MGVWHNCQLCGLPCCHCLRSLHYPSPPPPPLLMCRWRGRGPWCEREIPQQQPPDQSAAQGRDLPPSLPAAVPGAHAGARPHLLLWCALGVLLRCVCVCVCVLSRPPAGLVAWLVSWPVVASPTTWPLPLACWRGFKHKRIFTTQVGLGLLAFFRMPVCADVLYRSPHLVHLVLLQWCERPRQKDKAGLRAKLLEDMQVGASSF